MENQSVTSVILTNRDSLARHEKYHRDLNSTNEPLCLKECIEDTTP